ncbi:hypothetical protein [Brevibacillus sp. NL20B1]|uniref:hypothetical protein n=1 Tax=Brevibacillus sp. NL20B1 TaxID=2829799 RepID=UPI001B918CC5|nr:hypothetical protein [Brevibacillus sp. NL20B1]MBR8660582.1 hypothetical protein [Brevibacillus sp. NL20B1]
MSGQRKTQVTVKLNGERWDGSRTEKKTGQTDGGQPPIEWRKAEGIPFVPTVKTSREEDAWSLLKELHKKHPQVTAVRDSGVEPQREAEFSPDEEESGHFRRSRVVLSKWMRQGTVTKNLFATGGAVAIGLVFGLLVLSVFGEEQLSRSYQSVLSDTVTTFSAVGKDDKADGMKAAGPVTPEAAGTDADGTKQMVELQLPEERLYVAQIGVFQPETSTAEAIKPLDAAGIPHFLYKGEDKQYLFAAAAPARDAVLGFASNLKAKGMDVYVKEWVLPGVSGSVSVTGPAGTATPEDLNAFFQTGLEMARTLASQSGHVISSAQPVLSKEEASAIKEQHRRFLEQGRSVSAQESGQSLFAGMVNGMNQAVQARDKMAEAIVGGKTASAESYAWQVQAGVLTFWENYANWVRQVKAAE